MSDTKDVAQLVIRYPEGEDYQYFLAKRTRDGYWEFIGGKRKEDESMEDAALRELEEELQGVDPGKAEILELGDGYPVPHESSYTLYPVLVELPARVAREVDENYLSREHSEMAWIELMDFYKYETSGQYEALEKLELVNGDVAIGVVRKDGEYLVVKRSEENTSSGKWGFVSGKIEEGEEPDEAAVREVREETGLQTRSIRAGDPYIGRGELGFWRLYPVLLETGEKDVDLNWELSEHRWIRLEEIENLDSLGRIKAPEELGLVEDD